MFQEEEEDEKKMKVEMLQKELDVVKVDSFSNAEEKDGNAKNVVEQQCSKEGEKEKEVAMMREEVGDKNTINKPHD
jgi:hypothetical protein